MCNNSFNTTSFPNNSYTYNMLVRSYFLIYVWFISLNKIGIVITSNIVYLLEAKSAHFISHTRVVEYLCSVGVSD